MDKNRKEKKSKDDESFKALLKDDDQNNSDDKHLKNEKKTISYDDFKKEFKILVVDDSDLSRKSVVSILENEKFCIAGEAESAEKVMHLLSGTKFNLAIIDVVMPNISGIELAKTLSEKMEMMIIMMSSLNLENIVIESISSGAMDFLTKPFEKQQLIQSVDKIARQIWQDQQR